MKNKSTNSTNKITKNELKKQLHHLGIKVEGNYVKKSEIKKVILKKTTASAQIRDLMGCLYQTLGNKRYLHDFETILERLGELSAQDQQTIRYLCQDLRGLSSKAHESRKSPWQF